jgi:hypothetical protein
MGGLGCKIKVECGKYTFSAALKRKFPIKQMFNGEFRKG